MSRYEDLDADILAGMRFQDAVAKHHVSKPTFYRRAKVLGVKWPRKYPDEYYDVPRERRKSRQRKDKYHTDPTYRARQIESAVRWNRQNPKRVMIRSARFRAKTLGVPFNLKVPDILIPEVCPVLGVTLQPGNNKQKDNSPSLDRITPELGYVKGNVEVVSWRANRLKADASPDELERVAAWMRKQVAV